MVAREVGELAYGLWGVGWPWQCGRAVVERVVEVVVPRGLGLHDPGLRGFWCVWATGGSLSPVQRCVEGFPRGAFAACEGGGLEELLLASWEVFRSISEVSAWAAMRTPCAQWRTHRWASALRMWMAGCWGGVPRVSHDAMASSILEGWRCGVTLRLRS